MAGRTWARDSGYEQFLAHALKPPPVAFGSRLDEEDPDIALDGELQEVLNEPGAKSFTPQQVKSSTGDDRAAWIVAAEEELNSSFIGMGSVTKTTPEELQQVGGQRGVLPMTSVNVIKPGGLHKIRGCVCGNFQQKSPTEQVWTAQAETSSVMCGLRYAQLKQWKVSKLDVKGAFMYAPLPDGELIVVRPPQLWIDLQLIPADTLWTLRRAVYGLRCAPRAWGTYRDGQLRTLEWTSGADKYHLVQCKSDAQVWCLKKVGEDETLGLLLVYVDDFMLLSPEGSIREGFIQELQKIWKMSTTVHLTAANLVTFLGLELELDNKSGDLVVHQRSFTKQLLTKHGIDRTSKPMTAIQMGQPEPTDKPPTARQLRDLQAYAGEFNWLATRTRRSGLLHFGDSLHGQQVCRLDPTALQEGAALPLRHC